MKSAIIHRIGFYITLAGVLLIPFFFLPFTSEFYEYNKHFLLIFLSLLLLVTLSAGFILDKQVRITRSPLGLPLLLLSVAWLISTFTKTPNRTDALLDPSQTSTIISLVVFFFCSINFIKIKKDLDQLITTSLISISILSLISLVWGSGLMEKILPVSFLKSSIWTPTGNPLTTLIISLSFLPFIGVLIARQKGQSKKTLALATSLFLVFVSSCLVAYRTFRQNTPIFLSQGTSWAIALEALKVSPILGTGPSTYLTDFTRFRPISYNLTQNWAVRFNSSSNYYLQLVATVGLLGTGAFLFLAFKTITLFLKSFRTNSESSAHHPVLAASLSASLIFAALLFVPANTTVLFVLFLFLIITISSYKLIGSSFVQEANIEVIAATDSGHRSPILPWVFAAAALLVIVPSVLFFSKAYAAEVTFRNALALASKNDGKATYDALNRAVRLNPYKDTYRIAASKTNLLLANSAASKKDLTAEDRNLITQLIQQSIREAKNAVSLNPAKVTNIENLASVYQNLLNYAQGADSWALASYRQAIALDPSNPALRVSLGGTYFAQKNYDEAIRVFQQAADLKPNYSNAYYNLSAAYKEKKDYVNAFQAMQTVVNTLDKSTADYAKAQKELEELAKLATPNQVAPQVSAPAGTELESPKALPTPKVNPPLKLPSELGPESTVTPAPTTTPLNPVTPTP